MRILLCFVSDNKTVRDMVDSAKNRIIPITYLNSENVKDLALNFEVHAIEFGVNFAVENFILNGLERWEGVCLLTDNLEKLSHRLRTSCFVGEIEEGSDLTQIISKSVRVVSNYLTVMPLMRDKTTMEALMLPLDNFDAPELRGVANLFAMHGSDVLFYRNLTGIMSKLMKRYSPRRPRDEYKKKYFHDDQKKHFDYGHEDHGQFDTGAPHNPLCEVSGSLRFGWKISTKYHFNMMKAYKSYTFIKGTFSNCHAQPIFVAGETHVNIYANDFHK